MEKRAFCIIVTALLAAGAWAQPDDPGEVDLWADDEAFEEAQEGLITHSFIDADLRMALEDLGAQAGVNIATSPGVSGVVSAEMKQATLEEALDMVLAGTGFEVHETEDYYLVYDPDVESPFFPAVAETEVVDLNYARAGAVRDLLPDALQRYVRVNEETNALAITAPEEAMNRIKADLDKIDRPSMERTHMVRLEHVRASMARELLPPELERFARVSGGGEDANILAVTAPAGPYERIMEHLDDLDTPAHEVTYDHPHVERTQLVTLNHASAESIKDLLPEALDQYVRVGSDSNVLAVSAPEGMREGVLEDIAALDVERRHVMLDARVVVLEQADLLDFGVDWDWPEVRAGTATADDLRDDPAARDWPWELRIGYTPGREFTNALSLRLNLLTRNDEASIISSPQVLAQDGKEAEISVTTEEWFHVTGERIYRGHLEQIESGTILGITPRIGDDGKVTLDMEIEVSNVIARGEQDLPVVSRRTARSTVQVESGGTAAVAGLVDTRAQQNRQGVPGVSNVPLLGHAFRTDGLDHRARQVAVFITATLVDHQDDYFEAGRRQAQPVEMVDDDQFRRELDAALNELL